MMNNSSSHWCFSIKAITLLFASCNACLASSVALVAEEGKKLDQQDNPKLSLSKQLIYPGFNKLQLSFAPPKNIPRSSESTNRKRCKETGWCIASKGKDILGMDKITGWLYKQSYAHRTVGYRPLLPQKVNVRGGTNRYFSRRLIMRYYQAPVDPTPPTTTTIGQEKTTCQSSSIYSSTTIECTTTPAETVITPGKPGRRGGVRQVVYDTIYDCLDKTVGEHRNGHLKGKWKKATKSTLNHINKYCPVIESLELSDLTTYSR